MTGAQLKALEARLWKAADDLRAKKYNKRYAKI